MPTIRKLAICLAVAATTFEIGSKLFAVVEDYPNLPAITVGHTFAEPIRTVPESTAPADVKRTTRSDLTLDVDSGENPQFVIPRDITLKKRGTTFVDLDLTESIDNQELRLHLSDASEYRVLERYRTSLSISAEGPHLDLVDWRHFDSPWTELKSLGSNRFRTLAIPEDDYSRFPPTTTAEILKEVRRRAAKEWPELLELVKECKGPNDGACLVSISSIYLRIQKKVNRDWVDVGLVEVRVPMGC